MEVLVHCNVTVKGKVQGVWFRKYTLEKAQVFGIKGWVKNTEDGSVYIEAEAEHSKMKNFIAAIKKGSPLSEVAEVEIEEANTKGFSSFEIVY